MSETAAPDWMNLDLRASSVFTPSAPINSDALFKGRLAQVRAVVDAINQPGRHAILFGGRGVGKTSLGKILPGKLQTIEPCPIIAPFITCDSSDSFSSIWRKAFIEIRFKSDTQPPAIGEYDQIEDATYVWTPFEVRRTIEPFTTKGLLYLVLDEFDKVEDPEARQRMADTIKLFSDHAVAATIVLIGVADDVNGLIDDHRSIDRCLAQIPMPRMPKVELQSIVVNGLEKLGMTINRDALFEIVNLAKGLPTYAHMLALYAARDTLGRHQLDVTPENIRKAINGAIAQSEETIRSEYDKATSSSRETLYPAVLLACAMCKTDEYGRFVPSDLCEPLLKTAGRELKPPQFTIHLKNLCAAERGFALRMTGEEYRRKYLFDNPLLQPYVLMKGLDSGTITEKDISLRQEDDDMPLFASARRKSQ